METTKTTTDPTSGGRLPQLTAFAKPVLPATIGLALANTCFNVTLKDSTLHFTEALSSNGPLFVTVALLALFMFLLARHRKPLSPAAARMGSVYCIVLQVAAAMGMGVLELATSNVDAARFALVGALYVSSLGSLAFWLRCGRGASARSAALVVFGAVLISEPLICLAAFLPHAVAYGTLALTGLAQALCLHGARVGGLRSSTFGQAAKPDAKAPNRGLLDLGLDPESTGYFNLAKTLADDKRLLIMTALGIWILSLAKAVIRVFPAGQPIPYTTTTLAAYFVLSMMLAAVLLRLALNKNGSVMTVGIWVVMQNLAVVALIACGFLPERLDIGVSFTYVLDVLLFAYTWYVSLAFMNYGRQDPYYYIAGGLIAYLLPRSLTNVVMPLVFGGVGEAAATTAVAAALLLLCAQFLFLQFPRAPHTKEHPAVQKSPLSYAAQRAFGIEEPADTSTAMRIAIMQSHASRMQEQFLLSDREAEVLALYALGHTQDKIAAELHLSPGTVHTYVKRVYGKTNLHSRQAILDYIERYAE